MLASDVRVCALRRPYRLKSALLRREGLFVHHAWGFLAKASGCSGSTEKLTSDFFYLFSPPVRPSSLRLLGHHPRIMPNAMDIKICTVGAQPISYILSAHEVAAEEREFLYQRHQLHHEAINIRFLDHQ